MNCQQPLGFELQQDGHRYKLIWRGWFSFPEKDWMTGTYRICHPSRIMETLLNLSWLAVTLGLIGLWKFRWLRSRRNPNSRILPEAIAIACAISLLLPAISLTDDLHPEIVAVDAAAGKRNKISLAAPTSRPDDASRKSGFHSVTALLPLQIAEMELCATGRVIIALTPNPISQSVYGFGRSPPAWF